MSLPLSLSLSLSPSISLPSILSFAITQLLNPVPICNICNFLAYPVVSKIFLDYFGTLRQCSSQLCQYLIVMKNFIYFFSISLHTTTTQLNYIVFCYFVLYCLVSCIVLYRIVLYCIVSFCTVLYCSWHHIDTLSILVPYCFWCTMQKFQAIFHVQILYGISHFFSALRPFWSLLKIAP